MFFEILPYMGPLQPIKMKDLDKSHMKRRGLLNKHFCKNKIQISPTRQQKLAIFTFFHYKSMGSISCHIRSKQKTQLFFPPTCRWCMCNMRTIGPAVLEKKIFEIVDDGRTDDGRTPEHGYTISSPMSLRLR